MEKINFELKAKNTNCQVFSGRNLESELINFIKNFKSKKFAVVTDSKVARLHTKKFVEKLKKNGIDAFLIVFKEGEINKTRKTKAMIEDAMFKEKCGRDACVIAFGGGVTGDMAGFVAGTYMRGIPVIQVPTTTISIADSSYGGKTAIDVPAGKNLIGVYHQPVAVFMDSLYLDTLDKRNYVSGLIEIIKHGMINDKKFYDYLRENMHIILKRKGKEYEEIMTKVMFDNIIIKRDVVVLDEKESNLRKILNYGHTVGHAVEKLSNFKLQHGEAIAIGISVEAFIAYKMNISDESTFIEQKNCFEELGLPTTIPKKITTKKIMDLMCLDKKARNSKPEFTLISKMGEYAKQKDGNVAYAFEMKKVEEIINEYRKKYK